MPGIGDIEGNGKYKGVRLTYMHWTMSVHAYCKENIQIPIKIQYTYMYKVKNVHPYKKKIGY